MKKIIWISAILMAFVVFLLLHSTAKVAISTHVLFMGYPKAAFTSNLDEYEFPNKVEKNHFEKKNAHAKVYALTKPPFEKATKSELNTFIVRKIGFLYFADYYAGI